MRESRFVEETTESSQDFELRKQLQKLRTGSKVVRLVLGATDSSAVYLKSPTLKSQKYLFIVWGQDRAPDLSPFHFCLDSHQAMFFHLRLDQLDQEDWVTFAKQYILKTKPAMVFVIGTINYKQKVVERRFHEPLSIRLWKRLTRVYPSREEEKLVQLRTLVLGNQKIAGTLQECVQEIIDKPKIVETLYDEKSMEFAWDLSRQIEKSE